MLYLQAQADHWIMTLPDERYRAVTQTEYFLIQLCDTKMTKRIPRQIRERARSLLRHYPSRSDLNRAADLAPEVFQEKMEDLHKFVVRGSQQ